jgi:hypothetical protein
VQALKSVSDYSARNVPPRQRRRQVDADAHPGDCRARQRLGASAVLLDILRQKDDVRRILGYPPVEFGLYRRCWRSISSITSRA